MGMRNEVKAAVWVGWQGRPYKPAVAKAVNVTITLDDVRKDLAAGANLEEAIAALIFREFNQYRGSTWGAFQPLPAKRSHTAISVGDYVGVAGRIFRCAEVGWEDVTDEQARDVPMLKALGEAYRQKAKEEDDNG